jgi:UDPglucose 6-dehydrogenase
MRIAVIGTGYVGLVVGACLADSGNEVTCVDVDLAKVARLERGELPIYEPGLGELVQRNRAQRRLSFTTDLTLAVASANVVFIAVGTPEGETGEADLTYVLRAAEQIGRALRGYTVIVDKSTVPVGTCDRVEAAIRAVTDADFDVVSNPEFLKEGAALDDFLKPDRVVVGTRSERARAVMAELYAPFVRTENPILFMDPHSAELTKYAANAMLATRISFMNDIAVLCERVGADVDAVRRGMGADRRIGYPFLFPGIGYGGSCFPKDVKALIATAQHHGMEFDLLRAVERTNRRQRQVLIQKALRHFEGRLADRTFAVWGLSFKPRTDDVRESPASALIEALLGKGARVSCHDPLASGEHLPQVDGRLRCTQSPYEAVEGADGLFLVTEWNQFRRPDWKRIRTLMQPEPAVFDGRNLYDPGELRQRGFSYYGIGRH